MLKRVAESFLPDSPYFLEDNGMKTASFSVDSGFEFTRPATLHLLSIFRKRSRQVRRFRDLRAQFQHQFPSFQHDLVRLLESFFQDSPGGIVFWKSGCSCMKPQQKPLNALEECVVEVSGNPFPLGEPLVHPLS